MKFRLAGAVLMAGVLGACAPNPTILSTSADSSSLASPMPTAADFSQPSSLPTTEPSIDASSLVTKPSASMSVTQTSAPSGQVKEGWTILDAKVARGSEADQLAVTPEVKQYLQQRVDDECNVQFTVYAAHSDGFFLGEEVSVCDGVLLAIYGPMSGKTDRLVSFAGLEACDEYAHLGLPRQVPKTKLFPDGLACMSDAKLTSY